MGENRKSLLLLCFFLIVALVPACADNDDDDDDGPGDSEEGRAEAAEPNVDDLIVAGKEALTQRDAVLAYDLFSRAYSLNKTNLDASFGIVLSDQIVIFDWLYQLVYYLLNNPITPAGNGSDPKSLGDIIHTLIETEYRDMVEEMQLHLARCEAQPGYTFYLESYPLWVVEGHALIDPHSEWDASDMVMVRAVTDGLLSFFDFIYSYDATFDIYLFNQLFPGLGGDPVEFILGMCDLLIALLTDEDNPDFLRFTEDGRGYVFLPLSGIELGRFCLGFSDALDLARLETDPQEDDVIGYNDANANGRWDPEETMVVPYFGVLSPEQDRLLNVVQYLILQAGFSVLDGTELDVDPFGPNKFNLQDLSMILYTLGLEFPLPELYIDLGAYYRNPHPDSLRWGLLFAARLTKALLEEEEPTL